MTRFTTEFILLGFYVVLIAKSAWIRDWPRLLYWTGAAVLMTGVFMGDEAVMKKKHKPIDGPLKWHGNRH